MKVRPPSRGNRDGKVTAVSMTAVFAHRGCTEGFTENTIDAFAEARRLGADGVELDVRLTADGALAVHHDAEIPGVGRDRRAGGGGPARARPAAGRRAGGLRGHGGQRRDQERPPGPGMGPGRGGGGADGGRHRRGGLDGAGPRLVLPDGHAAGGAGRRRPPGASVRSGASPPRSSRRWPRRPRRGSAPSTRSCCRSTPELVDAGPCNGPCGQRVDRQRARGPAGHGGGRGGHRDHRPPRRRAGRGRRAPA